MEGRFTCTDMRIFDGQRAACCESDRFYFFRLVLYMITASRHSYSPIS